MAERGLAELDSETPILPLILRDELTTMKACEKLMELGHYVQGIRPPSVPPGKSRLRITINSLHLEDEIIRLARDLEFIMQETISCHKTGATQA
jgi:7-keto-8-aminopelargonate synthetase-like enzyme